MDIPLEVLMPILLQFNPWWKGEKNFDLPKWHRSVFDELMQWITDPPAWRALLLSGPRQIGKTTLILQAIEKLIEEGTPPSNILYVTFDHPICKVAGLNLVLESWRQLEPQKEGPEYLFLDEAQFVKNIDTWVKHQVDFQKQRRIIFTGSATPLIQKDQESGVGRWHTLPISTLTFYEYLQIKKIPIPDHPAISFAALTDTSSMLRLKELGNFLIGHFHEYLIRGGFPQTALIESLTAAQRLLREDIVEKVLKRDMTALFGVRRILELEQMFIYLCMHDGGIQDILTISKELGVSKSTVQGFIDLFESCHLIYRLLPFGYGKEVLRGKSKIYLRDPAIASAVLLRGKTVLEDPQALGQCVETAVTSHLTQHYRQGRFSYFRSKKDKEVDLVVEFDGKVIPVEVKYQSQTVQARDVPALTEFCQQQVRAKMGYAITKMPHDLGPLSPKCIRIPACLFCYWLGSTKSEELL